MSCTSEKSLAVGHISGFRIDPNSFAMPFVDCSTTSCNSVSAETPKAMAMFTKVFKFLLKGAVIY